MKYLEDNRKVFVLCFMVITATIASFFGKMDENLVQVFEWVATLFFGANGVEHVSKAVVAGKTLGKDLANIVTEVKEFNDQGSVTVTKTETVANPPISDPTISIPAERAMPKLP